jgi:hypothetical protein
MSSKQKTFTFTIVPFTKSIRPSFQLDDAKENTPTKSKAHPTTHSANAPVPFTTSKRIMYMMTTMLTRHRQLKSDLFAASACPAQVAGPGLFSQLTRQTGNSESQGQPIRQLLAYFARLAWSCCRPYERSDLTKMAEKSIILKLSVRVSLVWYRLILR